MVRATSTWRGCRALTWGTGPPSPVMAGAVSSPQLLGAVVITRWMEVAVIEAK